MGSFQLTVDQAGVDHLMATDGPIAKWVMDLGRPVLQAAQDGAPRATGQMADSLGLVIVKTGFALEAWVGVRTDRNQRTDGSALNSEVALAQEFGTRRGVPATHFLSSALNAARRG